MEMAQSNLMMFKRLLKDKKSIYDKKKLIENYKQSQIYKKNHCIYPSIDFYKGKRIANYFSALIKNKLKPLITINNNMNNKNQSKENKRKTSYQTIFYSNDHREINKKKEIFMNNVNINNDVQKKLNEHFNTYYNLKNLYETKKEEAEKNKKNEKNEETKHVASADTENKRCNHDKSKNHLNPIKQKNISAFSDRKNKKNIKKSNLKLKSLFNKKSIVNNNLKKYGFQEKKNKKVKFIE